MTVDKLMASSTMMITDISRLHAIKITLMTLCAHSQQYGILSLPNKLPDCTYVPWLLTKGIDILLIGMDLEQLEEILCNYVILGRYGNDKRLEAFMIIKGLICIQSGENIAYVEALLDSFIPQP